MDTWFTSSVAKRDCSVRFYMGDGWREFTSTKQQKKITPAFVAGTVSPPGPRPDQSPGRMHLRLQTFSRAAARGERELPSKADKRRHRPGRSHPTPPAPHPDHSLRPLPRRIRFVYRASAICGSVVYRTLQSLPTQSDRCVPAPHVPTESRLQVETGQTVLS